MAATESSRLNKTPFHASEPGTCGLQTTCTPRLSPNLQFFEAKRSKWGFSFVCFFLLYESLQMSATLASWINRPPLLGHPPAFAETWRKNSRVSASPGRPDYYLKGGESAGLVRQKEPEGEPEFGRVQGREESCTLPSLHEVRKKSSLGYDKGERMESLTSALGRSGV